MHYIHVEVFLLHTFISADVQIWWHSSCKSHITIFRRFTSYYGWGKFKNSPPFKGFSASEKDSNFRLKQQVNCLIFPFIEKYEVSWIFMPGVLAGWGWKGSELIFKHMCNFDITNYREFVDGCLFVFASKLIWNYYFKSCKGDFPRILFFINYSHLSLWNFSKNIKWK